MNVKKMIMIISGENTGKVPVKRSSHMLFARRLQAVIPVLQVLGA